MERPGAPGQMGLSGSGQGSQMGTERGRVCVCVCVHARFVRKRALGCSHRKDPDLLLGSPQSSGGDRLIPTQRPPGKSGAVMGKPRLRA